MARYTEDFVRHVALQPEVERVEYLAWSAPFPRALYRGPAPLRDRAPDRESNVRLHATLRFASPVTWERAARLAADCELLHVQANSQLHLVAQNYIARRANVPVVTTFHNARPHDRHEPYLQPLMRWLALRSRAIIVHNLTVAHRLSKALGVARDKVHVIPFPVYDGVDRGRWTRETARRDLGLPADEFVFLFLGAVRAYKGVVPLLEAFSAVPSAHLVIAGQCWDHRQEIEALAARPSVRGRVHLYLGYVPDDRLELFYKAADAAVFPYLSMQGDSAAVRMAQSFRLPIIVSDAIPGPKVGIEVAARAGFPGSLARALSVASTGALRGGAEELLPWDEFARRCVRIYNNVWSGPSASPG